MNTFKKSIAAVALAALMLPAIVPNVALAQSVAEEGPFETYLSCAKKCMKKYNAWTVRLSACAADCYVGIGGSVIRALI